MRKDPRFLELAALLSGSAALRGYRLAPIAYRLLAEPRLARAHAGNFRSTYRFPAGPFLESYLALKWEYRAGRERARREREAGIEAIMEGMPPEARAGILYLRDAERALNPEAPAWKKGPYPRSLKSARVAALWSARRWLGLVAGHAEALCRRYRSIRLPPADAIVACSILGLAPEARGGSLPRPAAINAAYKRLAKQRHPDSGGDAALFIRLKKARDYLLGET